jgi:hypothetical protein
VQPELVELEAELAVGAGRRAQRPVEVVGPGVVRALERLPPRAAVRDDVPAVPAHVQERAQYAVSRACNQYGNLAGGGGEVGTGLRDLACMTDVLPRTREDALALAAQDIGIRIPAPGQRPLHGCEL